ncbi:unnamed protein product [Victoria cruziana]
MDMGEQYGRTELEAMLKSHHHRFLPPLPLPSAPSGNGLLVPETMAHGQFKLPGFFHTGLFGRSHHPGMMVGVEDEAAAQLGCSLDYGAERLDFCSGNSIPTTATNLIANVANGGADLLLSSHSNENNNCNGGGGGENLMRFMGSSSSPSEKVEEREGVGGGGGDGGSSRWPRHETLTLLELRAQMDSKFREATQKGPLWEELSREMAEGYGYHRSGKKCREKFENLYKYYKKTKLGRTGRQDGKHYRFYAQLEALCGGEGRTTNNSSSITPNVNSSTNSLFDQEFHNGRRGKKILEEKTKADSPSISESDMGMASSDSSEEDLDIEKGNKMKKQKITEVKSWRKKMKAYIEKQMKVFMERQEEWFDRIVKTLDRREEERLATEEAWRKQENERLQVEHQFWVKERAWMQARDSTFMEALRKVMGEEYCTRASSSPTSPSPSFDAKEMQDPETNKEDRTLYTTSNNNNESTSSSGSSRRWPKHEILSLIRLRAAMDGRFQEGISKGSLWEEVSLKMAQLGYEKSGKRCKEKWENINKYFRKAKECNRKRRENSKTCPYFQYLEELYNGGHMRGIHEGFHNEYYEQEQKDADASAEGPY